MNTNIAEEEEGNILIGCAGCNSTRKRMCNNGFCIHCCKDRGALCAQHAPSESLVYVTRDATAFGGTEFAGRPLLHCGLEQHNAHLGGAAGRPVSHRKGQAVSAQPHRSRLDLASICPVRITIDVDGEQIVENLLWDLHDRHVSAEVFATVLCDDHTLPAHIRDDIARAITDQVDRFRKNPPAVPASCAELLVEVPIDLLVGDVHVTDLVTWDLADQDASPEAFAEGFVRDLGLPASFAQPVLFHLREGLINAAREGGPFLDEGAAYEPIREAAVAVEYEPTVKRISDPAERKNIEEAQKREMRAKRRNKGEVVTAEGKPHGNKKIAPRAPAGGSAKKTRR